MMRVTTDDIAVCVFTSALNLRERALSVQRTWLKRFPKGYLIGGYHDDPGLKMIALGSGVGEDYHSAHRKQFWGLMELHRRFPDAKWFYIVGCDAYVFADNLAGLLSGFDCDQELLVGGHCGEAEIDGERIIYPGGGPGFAVSRALVSVLLDHIPGFVCEWEIRQEQYRSACDVAFAYLAKKMRGVTISFVEGFYYGPPYYYPANTYKDGEGNDVNREVIDKPIAFHNLSIREMYLLDSGTWPRKKNLADMCFDKLSIVLTRKLKTRSLVNTIARSLYS
jgi:hypothetical protein